ncbi:MAG: HAMP domain-containing histidine kinase [Planctomycetes bacterium]|nr:HAMP domain-containing histidine kinase [Planctomycetota bacterium]MCB9869645.1 HAMP domain-containing histidine kinase [Planctomycetota bacterium]
MSLRGRLLVLMVLLNLLVLGVTYATVVVLQSRWLTRVTKQHLELIYRDYQHILPSGIGLSEINDRRLPDTVRGILDVSFRDYRDILIVSGPWLEINPLGAGHRDAMTFPIAEVRAGIAAAIERDQVLEVAGGRCVAIKSDGGEIEGGVWFVPILPPDPSLSFFAYAGPVAVSVLLFAALAGWVFGRTLGPPLARLGAAARRVGGGDYSARVPRMDSAPELGTVVEAFNTMADKVEGHTAELRREVERATAEAAAKERAMVMSSRLASMGTLAAGIAHEINNPIGGMQNAALRLEKNPNLGERDRVYLRLIQEGLERVARTARKMLDFSPKVLDAVAFDVAVAVDGARALIEHRLRAEHVTLTVDLAPGLPRLSGDPHEIQQVLLNLFLNSLHAMRGMTGRSISVRAEQVEGMLQLTVSDDGPGVDAATLEQVLHPFFSSSNQPDSTGLGLFISYTIVQNHGGELTVDSAPGRGFHVRIRLPVVRSAG